jgi:hypothetical protein
MARDYPSAAAFRQAIEARLRTIGAQRAVPIQTLRLKLAIERLLARLFDERPAPWVLKGGYAMELRFRPRARTTRDVDLSVGEPVSAGGTLSHRLAALHEALVDAARTDLHDFFVYTIAPARAEIDAAPGGGGVFGVEARMAGREFARFPLDAGFGDTTVGGVETLSGDDLLSFAGVPPARALAISKEQQFAEKLHAYTHPWNDRENTRSRDLVDVVVLIERGGLDPASVHKAMVETSRRRARHLRPRDLPPPPESWAAEVPAMARQAGTSVQELNGLFRVLSDFWTRHQIGRP